MSTSSRRPSRRARPARGILAGLAAALTLAGCGAAGTAATSPDAASAASGASTAADGPQVLTSVYPLQFVTERIAGPDATVAPVAPDGGDAHGVELAPHDVVTIEAADLVVHLSGLQPALDDALELTVTRALDVAGPADLLEASGAAHDHEDPEHGHDHDHAGTDPHFWLDPARLADVSEVIGAELAELAPDAAADISARTDALVADLEALEEEYRTGLASCTDGTIVVEHEAYGYLTDRYGLDQEGIAGIDPETEPSPARLAEIADVVEAEEVSTIFVESPVAAGVGEALASELGVTTAVLDPLEVQQDPGADYLDVMRANLDALRTALGCS